MSSNNATAMLQAFIEAGSALEELPKVRNELNETQKRCQTYADRVEAAEFHTLELDDEISRLRTALAQKEAELSDATFRHGEAQKVLDAIRGALPSIPVAVEPDPVAEALPVTEDNAQSTEGKAEPQDETVQVPEEPATDSPSTQSIDADKHTEDREHAEERIAIARRVLDHDGTFAHKPYNVTWAEWDTLGGHVPHWVSDRNVA